MRAAASPHQKSKAALLLLASAAFAALLLSPTTVRAQGFPGGVSLASAPDRCISVGSRFFSACNDDITRLAAALGVNLSLDDPDLSRKVIDAGLTTEEVERALAGGSAKPSAACCATSCEFNSQLCNCEPGLMQLAQAVSGATPELWASVMRMTGKDCGFEVKAGDTCPPNEELKVQAFSDPSCKA